MVEVNRAHRALNGRALNGQTTHLKTLLDPSAMAPPVDTTVHSPLQAFGNVQSGRWEVQPEEIQLGAKIGEGQNAVILKT